MNYKSIIGTDLQTPKCPLCVYEADYFLTYKTKTGSRNYYLCNNCASIHLDKNELLSFHEEEQRYAMHNNNVEDVRYQQFVSPISNQIIQEQNKNASGLDYGCGPGPVITHVLEEKGFSNIKLYDPYFFNNPKLLDSTYQFIICCEVIEHFSNPKKEFKLIKNLLNTGGKFYGKTELLHEGLDAEGFQKWWYKNDPTHCFFYSKKTLRYIAKTFQFSNLEIRDKFFVLTA